MIGTQVQHPPPARVVVVDVEDEPRPLAELGNGYAQVWAVLRRHGQPRAIVEVDLGTPEDVSHRWYWAAIAELKKRDVNVPAGVTLPDDRQPSISVVIPTIAERANDLDKCLAAVFSCDHPRFEVVLVDNRPNLPRCDPLPAILERHSNVRLVREPVPGISAARNAGVGAADGEIVAFTDDDVRVDRHWLRALGGRFVVRAYEQIVTGLVLPLELETSAQFWSEYYYGGIATKFGLESRTFRLECPQSHGWRRAVVVASDDTGRRIRRQSIYRNGMGGGGCNMSLRRRSWSRTSIFDPHLGVGTPSRGGEDTAAIIDTLWRGECVGYEPSAVVFHRHRRSYGELCEQIEGCGIGYTAMLTSLMKRDPRHIAAFLSQLPELAKRVVLLRSARGRGSQWGGLESQSARNEKNGRAYPAELMRREIAGYLLGPVAYLRTLRDSAPAPSSGTRLGSAL